MVDTSWGCTFAVVKLGEVGQEGGMSFMLHSLRGMVGHILGYIFTVGRPGEMLQE
jgi:hypothetical protein